MRAAIENLGWTLLHSLWEGAIIWLGLQLALATLRHHAARTRCLAGCIALALAVITPLITFSRLEFGAPRATASPLIRVDAPISPAMTGPGIPSLSGASAQAWRDRAEVRVAGILPWLVLIWTIGSAWSLARLALGLRAVSRLGGSPRRPLPRDIEGRFRALAWRLGIGPVVRIGESVLVEVPSVVGWLKPLILVPVGAFSGLSAEQIDGLLAHELAHVVRRDFAVNLLQSVCEVVYFYHPAVRAISQSIRTERENACDDIAVELSGDGHSYATALAKLEHARSSPLTPAATGKGILLPRIRRLVTAPAAARPPLAPAVWAIAMGVAVYFALFLLMPGVTGRIFADQPVTSAAAPIDSPPAPVRPVAAANPVHGSGRMVRVEAIIAEVTLSDADPDGLKLGAMELGAKAGSGPGLSAGLVDARSVDTALKAASADGKRRVRVLSTPVIVTADKKTAIFTDDLSEPSANGSESAGQTKIHLSVTPVIGDKNEVQLTIDEQVDEKTASAAIQSSGGQPMLSHREVKSFVSVANGQTIALEGLQKTSPAGGERTEFLFFFRPLIADPNQG